MKANKLKILYEILIEIEGGKTYSETLRVNGSKWRLSERTFVRYWNAANKEYEVILKERKAIFKEMTTRAYLKMQGVINL